MNNRIGKTSNFIESQIVGVPGAEGAYEIVKVAHDDFGTVDCLYYDRTLWFLEGQIPRTLGFTDVEQLCRRMGDGGELSVSNPRDGSSDLDDVKLTLKGVHHLCVASEVRHAQRLWAWIYEELVPWFRTVRILPPDADVSVSKSTGNPVIDAAIKRLRVQYIRTVEQLALWIETTGSDPVHPDRSERAMVEIGGYIDQAQYDLVDLEALAASLNLSRAQLTRFLHSIGDINIDEKILWSTRHFRFENLPVLRAINYDGSVTWGSEVVIRCESVEDLRRAYAARMDKYPDGAALAATESPA